MNIKVLHVETKNFLERKKFLQYKNQEAQKKRIQGIYTTIVKIPVTRKKQLTDCNNQDYTTLSFVLCAEIKRQITRERNYDYK